MQISNAILAACVFGLCVLLNGGAGSGAETVDALPKPTATGFASVNGVRLWYGSYGTGQPVILLHGGITSSATWYRQIPVLRARYRVIVVDSRGHGRSTRTQAPFTYELMASDLLGVMDHLHLRKAAIVGWSDGADIGILLAIHHSERVSRLFAFAGNTDRAGLKHAKITPAMRAFFKLSARQYKAISPTRTTLTRSSRPTNNWPVSVRTSPNAISDRFASRRGSSAQITINLLSEKIPIMRRETYQEQPNSFCRV